MAFERFIHPYTLMAVGAVGGLVYLGMSTFKKKDRIVNNGVNRNKIQYFPQWAESMFIPMKSKNNLLRKVFF